MDKFEIICYNFYKIVNNFLSYIFDNSKDNKI